MKKIISIISTITIFTLLLFSINVYADSLDTIDISTSKDTIRPGEEVKVLINFGQDLGAYTFDIAYDNNIFEYVSVDGGTANDTKDKVRVTFYDSSGGTSPRNNMSIIFKAKDNITTSNPTEFTITAEGLANADASVNYDDITIPIVKNVTVEPEYKDYKIDLTYSGDIVKNMEKEMKISYSSEMGRYYEKARLIAEVETKAGGDAHLIGIDSSNFEHDIIQNGWGDAQGYEIGGKDYSQVLNVTGLFTEAGDYKITLKLINREDSDSVIAENSFNIKVSEQSSAINNSDNSNNANNNNQENTDNAQDIVTDNSSENENQENMPESLPKTGANMYAQSVSLLILLSIVGLIIRFKRK